MNISEIPIYSLQPLVNESTERPFYSQQPLLIQITERPFYLQQPLVIHSTERPFHSSAAATATVNEYLLSVSRSVELYHYPFCVLTYFA